MILKTIVYIDGYNLYYGLLRKSNYKWLDIYQLFVEQILDVDKTELIEVRYYTAPVLGRMCDDIDSPKRQRQYLQALKKYRAKQVVIVEGKLVVSTPFLRTVDGQNLVQVQDFVEKKTDVNIAVDLLVDSWSGRAQQVVVCSNDSDLEPALKALRLHCPEIRVGLVSPIAADRYVSKDLVKYSDWQKVIRTKHLQHSQLPHKLPNTAIVRPDAWQIA